MGEGTRVYRDCQVARVGSKHTLEFQASAFIDESFDQVKWSKRGGAPDVDLGSTPDERRGGLRRVVPKRLTSRL